MRKVIKIFLGSSIVEFANERRIIENFIWQMSRKFEKWYNIQLEPLLCENFDDAYTKMRMQEVINEKIRESELCFFIFFTKAGECTREEFEVARKQFEETGKPQIRTYFKVLKDETAEQNLFDFMEELDKTFGHYYGTFEHIDTIKLRILLSLKLQEMDFVEIKVEDGHCIIDGKKVMSLENVSEFANNEIFKQLKAELAEVESKYFPLKAKYGTGELNSDETREYIEIATKRQNLLDTIEELQKNIFNMSLRMCKDDIRGEITQRQKEAYRLFEKGDIEGANRILDFAEIEDEYLRDMAMMEANMKKRSEIFIRETKTKIEILSSMVNMPSRFDEIENLYDKILPVALKFNIELNTLIMYIEFLFEQNKHNKAYEIGRRIEKVCDNENNKIDKEIVAGVCFMIGVLCNETVSKNDMAEKYFLKAIEIYENLTEVNPEKYNAALAGSYNNVGIFYEDQNQVEKAEKYYLKAIAICRTLAEENLEKYGINLLKSYNNVGVFYYQKNQIERAEICFFQAITIAEKLVSENPEKYSGNLANTYNSVGIFYQNQEKIEKTEEYFLKAIAIYEILTKENPEKYSRDLARSYNNAGSFYQNQGNPITAEAYYLKSIEIREEFERMDTDIYGGELAVSYSSVGNFYRTQGKRMKAEEYLLKSIKIREKLAEKNPTKYSGDLAISYNGVSLFYSEQGNRTKAEEYLLKSIKIREKLVEWNSEKYSGKLADSYNNAGIFYYQESQAEKAEEYYLKSMAITERLVKVNPKRYSGELAISYNNIGIFYYQETQVEKAEEYYQKSIEIRERLVEENPRRYSGELASSYNNMGVFYKNQGKIEKAEEYYLKSIEIRERLAEENPEKYIRDIADSYNNMGVFYHTYGQIEKAEKYYLISIEIRERIAEENPEKYGPDLATSYYNYAIFSRDEVYFYKAIIIAQQHPNDPMCKRIISALTKQ